MEAQVTFYPAEKPIKVRVGTSLLQAVHKARIAMPTRCGGKASCMMCKIQVEEDSSAALSPPSDAEQRKLGMAELEKGTRLACQCKVLGDAAIRLPENPLKAAIRRQMELKAQESDELW